MANLNNDYLKFDAYSIKNAIIEKLSDDTNFTDQIFEASNLTAMIDVFSVVFEYLMYYVNHGASEAMFNDVRLYENVNRIVKMLGYNPLGNFSSKSTFSFENGEGYETSAIFSDAQKIVSKYAYMDTGLTDTRGNTVYYSPIRNIQVNDINYASDNNTFVGVNGRWKLYERTFISNGDPFEEYILDVLLLDSTDTDEIAYVGHPYVDVYVKTTDTATGEIKYDFYEAVPDGNIFSNNTSILKPDTQKFELRINENKYYTLKFGDGIHENGLLSNYTEYKDGKIGVGAVNEEGALIQGIAGASDALFYAFQNTDADGLITQTELNKLLFKNVTESSPFTLLESVSEIKEKAPNWFRSGGHLVSKSDYRDFVLSVFSEDIYSVRVMNNYEYSARFFKWLYDYNALSTQIRNYDYLYVDSCDFNNIYIWVKAKYPDYNKQYLLDAMNSRKTLTSEPVIHDAIDKIFVPCLNFNTSDSLPANYDNLKYDINDWDPNYENWIEIRKDIDSFISVEKIRSVALKELKKFFNPLYNKLGDTVNIDDLYTILSSIDGVKEVRTAYRATDASNNGLSFATWTPLIIGGKDVSLVNGKFTLEEFHFPELLLDGLESRIKVVSESFNQTSIEF